MAMRSDVYILVPTAELDEFIKQHQDEWDHHFIFHESYIYERVDGKIGEDAATLLTFVYLRWYPNDEWVELVEHGLKSFKFYDYVIVTEDCEFEQDFRGDKMPILTPNIHVDLGIFEPNKP